MINFVNRTPTRPNRKKIIKADGSSEYVTIEYADDPTINGTPLNRDTLMGMQGFINSNIVFNDDGSINQVFDDGSRYLVTFLSNGSIKETLIDTSGNQTIRTTTFEPNGAIRTEVS